MTPDGAADSPRARDRVNTPSRRREDNWRQPRVDQQGLKSYLLVLRERVRLIALVMGITLGVAVLYLATATKMYEAEADLLVTPVAGDQTNITGLPLLRESSDPTRDVETAARLVTARGVATTVIRKLHLNQTPDQVLGSVDAAPVAQSDIVAVTAKRESPEEARDVANAFGEAVIANRTAVLHRQLDKSIASLRQRERQGQQGATSGGQSLSQQIAQLETLRAQDDPTLSLQTRADAPASPSSPRPVLTVGAAILAGLVLGVGGAFALNTLDPRLRREEQLRELYRLPILARVPKERHAPTSKKGRARHFRIGPRIRRRKALAPGELSPATIEAYRALRGMLAAQRMDGEQGRSFLVTGPSPSEGKTTSAIGLASSLALAGRSVILIEADFRRPTVGDAFGARPAIGIGKVLLGGARIEDALVPAKPFGQNLRLLLVDRQNDSLPELLSLPLADSLLSDAMRLADFVVVDSPPLTEVIDALPLARQVDDVVIVVRLGNSQLPQLARLGELFDQNDIRPAGFVVVGVGSSDDETYYLSSRRSRAELSELADPPDRDPQLTR